MLRMHIQHVLLSVQVLAQTSYLRTLLTVQNLDGSQTFQTTSPSFMPSGLSAATNYTITITLVFLGGEEGTPVIRLATTMDGGTYPSLPQYPFTPSPLSS